MRFSDEENEALRDVLLVQSTWSLDSSVFVTVQNLWFSILYAIFLGIRVKRCGEGLK